MSLRPFSKAIYWLLKQGDHSLEQPSPQRHQYLITLAQPSPLNHQHLIPLEANGVVGGSAKLVMLLPSLTGEQDTDYLLQNLKWLPFPCCEKDLLQQQLKQYSQPYHCEIGEIQSVTNTVLQDRSCISGLIVMYILTKLMAYLVFDQCEKLTERLNPVPPYEELEMNFSVK